jgi:hypothetical protein
MNDPTSNPPNNPVNSPVNNPVPNSASANTPREPDDEGVPARLLMLTDHALGLTVAACETFIRRQDLVAIKVGPNAPWAEAEARRCIASVAQSEFRRALPEQFATEMAERLGVPTEFLRAFDAGWCDELGSVTLGMKDETGRTAAIDLIPLHWSPHIAQNSPSLFGMRGLIAYPDALRMKAPLVVGGDLRGLYKHWEAGANVAYMSTPSISSVSASAIMARWHRTGGGDGLLKIDTQSWYSGSAGSEPYLAIGEIRKRAWKTALKKARLELRGFER